MLAATMATMAQKTIPIAPITALALRLPPQKRRDRTLAIVYNRGHEINNQYQREALDP